MAALDFLRRNAENGLDRSTKRAIAKLQKRGISVDLSSSQLPLGGMWTRGDITLRPNEMVNAVLERCVTMKADAMAALDLEITRGKDDTVIENHPIAQLWNRDMNSLLSARATRSILLRRMQRHGQTFAVVDRGPTAEGPPAQIMPIFNAVEVIVDNVTDPIRPVILGYRVTIGLRRKIELLPSEVLWLRLVDGETIWDSIAPAVVASYPVKVDAYAREWQLGELRNGGRPSGILNLGDMSQAAQENVKSQMRSSTMGASNAGKVITISGDQMQKAEFQRISMTPAEMSYVESRQVNAEEIAMAMGVPRDLLFGESTYDNQRAAKTTLWSDTLVPELDVIASELDRQLVADPNETCAFDTDDVEALREQQQDLYERVTNITTSDIPTINEAREMVDLLPLPAGMGGELTLTAYRAQFGIAPPLPKGHSPTATTESITLVPTKRDVVGTGPNGGGTTQTKPMASVPKATFKKHVGMAHEKMYALLRKQGHAIHDHLMATMAADSHILDNLDAATGDSQHRAQIAALAATTITAAAQDGGTAIMDQVGGQSYAPGSTMTDYIASQSNQIADDMSSTTSDELHKLVSGLEDFTAVGVSAAILDYFAAGGRADERSDMFATNEVYPAMNMASREAAAMSGAAEGRQWETAGDANVDGECAALDGEIATMDGAYPGGNEPGDVHFSCRCTESYLLRDNPPGSEDNTTVENGADHSEALTRMLEKMERVLERRAMRPRRKGPLFDFAYWDEQLTAAELPQRVEAWDDERSVAENIAIIRRFWGISTPEGGSDRA